MAQAASTDKVAFVWEGKDRNGKRVKGEQWAANEAMVRAQLRREGTVPLKVRKKPKPLFGGGKKKIRPADIAGFARQAATMTSSGVPLVQSLEIIAQGADNPSMRDLVNGIRADVEGGTPFADALAKRRVYFDDLFVNLVRAGEESGNLEAVLDRIATYKEKTESLKGKIKKAMFYPTAVVVVAFIVTAILLIFVIPQFQDLFQGFGADLPGFTLFVIAISEAFQKYWWAIFGGLGAAIAAFIYFKKRSKRFQDFLDRLVLKLPIFGELAEKAALARFARTLSTMFAAGVPMVEALDSVSGATGNVVFENAIADMRDQTATGQPLQVTMKSAGLFPAMVIQMVGIGEETGEVDSMLAKVADFYEEEVDNMVDGLSSLLEPMIMAFLGIVVGGLVIAMYLPIFKLGSVV